MGTDDRAGHDQVDHDKDVSSVERFARDDRTMARLGIRVDEAGPGRAVTVLRVAAEHCDHRGVLKRGHAFTLADAAIALASNSYGPVALLVHADATWAADAAEGSTVTARCAVVHREHDTATFEARLNAGDGTLVGVVLGTTRTPRR